ncbi:MAG: hypothetical protein PHV37_00780 [Candidatus Gastranaerophilales bacterium]|nr:hypothetical protein [Candidatus Gastranaerophilales bacterium]
MKKSISIFLIFILGSPAFCRQTQKAQIKYNEIRTYTIPFTNQEKIEKAVIYTFQNSGFTITNYEPELGFISARKTFDTKSTDKLRVSRHLIEMGIFGTATIFSWGIMSPSLIEPSCRLKKELEKKPVVIDSFVSLTKLGDKSIIKLSLIEKIYENKDGYCYRKDSPRKIIKIKNPKIYEEFFTQVDSNIY